MTIVLRPYYGQWAIYADGQYAGLIKGQPQECVATLHRVYPEATQIAVMAGLTAPQWENRA